MLRSRSARPLEGYRQIVRALLDMQFSHQDIRTLIGDNSAACSIWQPEPIMRFGR